MNNALRILCVVGLCVAGAGLSGCEKSRQVGERDGVPILSGDGVKSTSYGEAVEFPKVRITANAGAYNFLYTARSEIEGSKAEPKGVQKVDFGKGGENWSDFRLYLDTGFVVIGGCFPVYKPSVPDGSGVTLPPRPWAPVVAAGVIATSAQGTRYSVYNETNASGQVVKVYIFFHSGSQVHAWTIPPGSNPQVTGPTNFIPRSGMGTEYMLAQKNTSNVWTISYVTLPPMGDTSLPRRYFDACNAIATDWNMNFPSCEAIPPN